MSFWGIEVKPGKPVTHCFDRTRGRLRISQATLGIGSGTTKSLVQCNVGNKTPVFLCALLPDKTESCHLDLEFEETNDVVFSVLGPRSAHLTGYYVSKSTHAFANSDTESYGEDIVQTDTEASNQCTDEDEYGGSFIDDDEPQVFPSSPDSSDGDTIANWKRKHNQPKKKHLVIISESEDDNTSQESEDEDNHLLSALNYKVAAKKISPKSGEKSAKVASKVTGQAENGGSGKDGKEGNIDTVDTTNLSKICKDRLVSDRDDHKLAPENDAKPEKSANPSKKRKNKSEDAKSLEVGINGEGNMYADHKTEKLSEFDMTQKVPIGIESPADERSKNGQKLKKRKKGNEGESLNECQDSRLDHGRKEVKQEVEGTDIGKDLPATIEENKLQTSARSIGVNSGVADGCQSEKKHEKKKKKKTKVEDKRTDSIPERDMSANEIFVKTPDKDLNLESSRVRTLSNGLTIEDLAMGEADGKVAIPGKKVKVLYTGMLKENGRVFDSNIGNSPYKFRLGDEEIIDGWNIGLEGMRVGGKRRLTIPPPMGYGSQGGGENIPPNSWLVFEIELVGVRR